MQFFTVASFQPLTLETRPESSFLEVLALLKLNVSKREWRAVEALRRPIDLRNIRALWLEQPLDPRGNLSEKELEEALLTGAGLPDYLVDFLAQYETVADRLRHFASLYASLYRAEEGGFIGRYYALERELRLNLTALRAKREGRDVTRELQYEDPTDPLVASILAQRDAAEYIPDDAEVGHLFREAGDDPLDLYKAMLELRFRRIEEMELNRPFSLTQVLGYLARLLLVEQWLEANAMSGGDRLLGEV